MTTARKTAIPKTSAKKPVGSSDAGSDQRRQFAESLQKIHDRSKILTAQLDRLRQRLTPSA